MEGATPTGDAGTGGQKIIKVIWKRNQDDQNHDAIGAKRVKMDPSLEVERSIDDDDAEHLGGDDDDHEQQVDDFVNYGENYGRSPAEEEVMHPEAIQFYVKHEGGEEESSVVHYLDWGTNLLGGGEGPEEGNQYILEEHEVKNEEIIVPEDYADPHDQFPAPKEKKFPCGNPSCTASFQTRKSLRFHQQSNHRSFRCVKCEFQTDSARILAEHGVLVHSLKIGADLAGTPKDVIHCFWWNCNFKAMDEELIVLHLMKDHLELPLGKKALLKLLGPGNTNSGSTPKKATSHQPGVMITKMYGCVFCGVNKDSKRNSALHETRTHARKMHYTDDTGKRQNILVCARPDCEWKMAEEEHLVLHILQGHEGMQLNQEEQNELTTATTAMAKLDFVKSDEDIDDVTYLGQVRRDSFECPSCFERFAEETKLVAHQMFTHKFPITNDQNLFGSGSAINPSKVAGHVASVVSKTKWIVKIYPPGSNPNNSTSSQGSSLCQEPDVKNEETLDYDDDDKTRKTFESTTSETMANLAKELITSPLHSQDLETKQKEKRPNKIEVLSRTAVTVLETKPIQFSSLKTTTSQP